MPIDFDAVKADAKTIVQTRLTGALEGMFNNETDQTFLEQMTCDVAEQTVLMATAATPEERETAKTNLEHLAATLESEATKRYLLMYEQGKEAFIAILRELLTLGVAVAFAA